MSEHSYEENDTSELNNNKIDNSAISSEEEKVEYLNYPGLDDEQKKTGWNIETKGDKKLLTLSVTVLNHSQYLYNNLDDKGVKYIENSLINIKSEFKKIFSRNFQDTKYEAELVTDTSNLLRGTEEEGMFLRFYDEFTRNEGEGSNETVNLKGGFCLKAGDTKNNVISVAATQDKILVPIDKITRNFAHEAGHTSGLQHPWEKENDIKDIKQDTGFGAYNSPEMKEKIKENIMNSNENNNISIQSTEGTELTDGQYEKMMSTINNN